MTINQFETPYQYEQYSAESEQAVIGSILIKPHVLLDVMDVLKDDDFFIFANKIIYQAFIEIDSKRRPIDPLVVADYLRAGGMLDEIGGMAYLLELAHNTPSAVNVMAYARQVKDKARERAVINVALAMRDEIQLPEHDTDTRINNALALPLTIESGEDQDKTTIDHLKDAVDDLQFRHANDGKITGLSTGFRDLDARYNGLRGGQLMILAARPAMGKTTLALNLCQSFMFDGNPGAVAFFSLEMPGKSIMAKMACSIGGIDYGMYQKGLPKNSTTDEWEKVNHAFVKMKSAESFVLDDRSGLTFQQIRSKAIRLKRKHGSVKCIMVDYLTLVRTPGKSSRTEEVGALSRGFKQLAKELDCPVILLAQLNRGVETRTEKKPRMADLRDSGEIEQDADIITFIYRDEIYNPNTNQPGIAELITAKAREGEPGTDFLRADLMHSRFKNLHHGYEPPEEKPKEKKFY